MKFYSYRALININKLRIVKFILLAALFVSFEGFSKYRVSNTDIGTNKKDRLYGSSDTITFGLKGNDRLYGRYGTDESILSGGKGRDRYYSADDALITIADNGKGYDKLFARNVCFYCSSSKVATFDRGRHLVFGNAWSGARIVILDWKKKSNRIEKIYLSDKNISYKYVKKNLKKMSGYLGNISKSKLRRYGVDMPSKRNTSSAIRYYKKKAKKYERRANRFSQGFSYSALDNYNGLANLSYSNERHNVSYQYGEFFNNDIDQDIEVYSRSNFDEYNNYSFDDNSKTNAINYAYKLNDNVQFSFGSYQMLTEDNQLMIDSDQSLLHTYGMKGSFQVHDNFKIIAGHKFKEDEQGLNGDKSFFNLTDIQSSKTSMSQIGFSYDISSTMNISSSYSQGVGEIDIVDNFYVAANDDLKLKSYGFDVSKKQLFSEKDSLKFSYSVPSYVYSGSTSFKLPELFGESAESVNYKGERLENYSLAYTRKFDGNQVLNLAVSVNETALGPTNTFATLTYGFEF